VVLVENPVLGHALPVVGDEQDEGIVGETEVVQRSSIFATRRRCSDFRS
jgi:hypothetical protein